MMVPFDGAAPAQQQQGVAPAPIPRPPMPPGHQSAPSSGIHQQMNGPYSGMHRNVGGGMPGGQPYQMNPQSPAARHNSFSMPGGPGPHQGGPPQGGYSSHPPLHSSAQQPMHPNMAPQMHRNASSGMGMPPSMSQQSHDGRMISSSSGRNQQYNMGNTMGTNGGGGNNQNQLNNSMNGRSMNSSMGNSMNGMGNTMNNNSMNGANNMNAPMNNNMNNSMNGPMGGNSMNAMNGNSMNGTMSNGMNSSRNNNMMNSRSGSGGNGSGNGSSVVLNGNWQTDGDTPHRREMIQHIVKMLKKDKTGSSEWLSKLPQMAKQLEVSLYRNAHSFGAYVDMNTLKQRLQQIAVQVSQNTRVKDNRRDRQQQNSGGMRQNGTSSSSYMGNNSTNRTDRSNIMNNNGGMANMGGGMAKPSGGYQRSLNNTGSTNSGTQSSSTGLSAGGGGSGGTGRNNDPEWKIRIRHKQQRLLLLHHSAKCPHEDGRCPVTPHCADMKRLWRHMEGCKDNQCRVPHCFSSRAILSHYRKCKDPQCPACGPVRETVRKSQGNRGSSSSGSNRPSSSTGGMPNPSNGPQPRMKPNDVGNRSSNTFPAQPMGAQPNFSQSQSQQVPNIPPPSSNNTNSGMLYPPAPLLGSTKTTQGSYRSGGNSANGGIGSDFATPAAPPTIGVQNSNNNIQTAPTSSSSRRNDTEWQKVRHKQQRLLLLRHASRCEHKSNCPVTPHCANMKKLWEHIAHCKDQYCNVAHCLSSRYVLSHYRRCKNEECPACGPVRETIRKTHDREQQQGNRPAQSGASVTPFDNAPVPSSSPDITPATKRQRVAEPAPTPTPFSDPQVQADVQPSISITKPPIAVTNVPAPPVKETRPPSPAPSTIRNEGTEDLSLLDSFTADQITTHLASLNKAVELPPAKLKQKCLEVLKALQTHTDGWVFNVPVDPVVLNLPDYANIIKNPMDLGSIQKKLEKGDYRAVKEFQSDVNLTFDNAMTYNDLGSVVYGMAKSLKAKFTIDYKKLVDQLAIEERERKSDIRGGCLLCGSDKLFFEAPIFFCNGINCTNARIRRNSHFYIGGDNKYFWCNQCYGQLDAKVPIELIDMTLMKQDLKKKKNDETVEESWVQCDSCENWIHQICGLFNTKLNSDRQYSCPLCLLEKRKKEQKKPPPRPAGAADLPRTKLSEFIEKNLKKQIQGRQRRVAEEKAQAENITIEEALKETNAIGSITLRQVTSMDRKLEVKERMRKRYAHKKYPEEFSFRCKCLLVFQEIDGVDVVLFALYLYEHGEDNPLPNQRTVYISYLDSVHYMTPRKIRTFVYHEILISYLDYARQRGFSTCHIWACPPLKGDDYIFYAKPEDQKTPRDSRLRQWYLDMLIECQNRGIVGKMTNMYDLYFANESLDATALPYHEGDYFPGEAENIIKMIEDDGGKKNGSSKKKKQKNQSKLKNRGGTRSTGCDEEALLASGMINLKDLDRDKVMVKLGEAILPMKESFLVAFLNWSGVKEEDAVVPEAIMKYREEHPENISPLIPSNKRKADGEIKENPPPLDKNGHPIKVIDDDKEDVDCEFLNNRQEFLNFCKEKQFQFDDLRRAKHTSMMVLWHLQNRENPKYVQQCVACNHEILSGKRYHCRTCHDFDLCEKCYKNPKTNRGACTHKLEEIKVSDTLTETSGLTEAERENRQRNLALHIQLIEHASRCVSSSCTSKNCAKMKEYLQHAHTCKTKIVGGCRICKRIWTLLRIHAQKCKDKICPIPQCMIIREKMRELQKQQHAMDDRRRQEMNRHYRRGSVSSG
uniref:histone acetyltransferase n=1 Tax=Pseudo-nitzschia australis TaxID=44445 RepID=A0A6V0BSR0_9STRA